MRLVTRALTVIALYVVLAIRAAHALPERIEWRSATSDLEVATTAVSSYLFFGTKLTLLRTSLKEYRVTVVRATEVGNRVSSAETVCRAMHGALCINASFFDEQGKPLGLLIERGIALQRMHNRGNTLTGIFQVFRSGVSIVHRLDFRADKTLEAVQAGPRLIAGGYPVKGLKDSGSTRRRSGVCVDLEKRLTFFVAESSVASLPVSDLQSLLLHRDIACWDALNLDGGGSTQLFVSPPSSASEARERVLIDIPGEDQVPVFLSLIPIDQPAPEVTPTP